MAAIATALGAYISVAPGASGEFLWRVPVASAVAFMFTAAGNSLNDYTDRKIDKVNHPMRPLPSERIEPTRALWVSGALFAGGLAPSAILGAEALLVATLNMVAMVVYDLRYKKSGLAGNLIIAYLVASLFLFGGLSVYRNQSAVPAVEALERIATLFVLAFLATLGREIVKDIEDMEGDVDRRTVARMHGASTASLLAAAAFLGGVALSGLPFYLQVLSIQSLPIIALADAMFIYCALNSRRKPRLIGQASKYAMLVALVAFLVGGSP